MKSKSLIVVALIIILIALGAGGFYYYSNQIKSITPTLTPNTSSSPSSKTVVQQQPTATTEASNLPTGWETYTNDKYGFEISYPANYKALDDKDNLYGWPDAVVLIYSGGQSYDLPIEVWDTKTEYEAKYKTQLSDLV